MGLRSVAVTLWLCLAGGCGRSSPAPSPGPSTSEPIPPPTVVAQADAAAERDAGGVQDTVGAAIEHDDVEGRAIDVVDVSAAPPKAKSEALDRAPRAQRSFAELGLLRAPGAVRLSLSSRGPFLRVPHCAGRTRVRVDGAPLPSPARGPVLVPLDATSDHTVDVDIDVSSYEKRIACGEPFVEGERVRRREGLSVLRFDSPHAAKHEKDGAGEVVLFVPPGHDWRTPAALLVGVHPWNGSAWTYAAYRELLDAASTHDVVLAMPSGLGNSLYTADAEDEVMRAVDAVQAALPVDPARVSLWGASMGGAGATTIGFHRPDRFAGITSYFGDSRYDLSTYVRGVLGGAAGAHQVDALDVVENARHVPVRLIHGEEDKVSKIEQSVWLADALRARGFPVTFDRVPGMGHEGPLVVRFVGELVRDAARQRAPRHPARVSFRSVRAIDVEAYGVRIERDGAGDAFVDVERRDGGVVVHAAQRVRVVTLARGALGRGDEGALDVTYDPGVPRVRVVQAP